MRMSPPRVESDVPELPNVERRFEPVELRTIDPAKRLELVVGPNVVARRDLAHEHEVHVQPFRAGEVLFVADQACWHAVERAGQRVERACQPGLLAQLAHRGFERRFTRLDLAADRQPRLEPAMLDHEHALATPRVDRDRKRATAHGATTTNSSAFEEWPLTVITIHDEPIDAMSGIWIVAASFAYPRMSA